MPRRHHYLTFTDAAFSAGVTVRDIYEAADCGDLLVSRWRGRIRDDHLVMWARARYAAEAARRQFPGMGW